MNRLLLLIIGRRNDDADTATGKKGISIFSLSAVFLFSLWRRRDCRLERNHTTVTLSAAENKNGGDLKLIGSTVR